MPPPWKPPQRLTRVSICHPDRSRGLADQAVRPHPPPRPLHAGVLREAARDAAGDAPLSRAAPSARHPGGRWTKRPAQVPPLSRAHHAASGASTSVLAGTLPAPAIVRSPGGLQAPFSGRPPAPLREVHRDAL